MQQAGQNMQFNGLPDVIRMRAIKGFRGQVDGQLGIVNPGDVVDVPRDLALTLRYGQKAVMVEPTTQKKRSGAEWLPERKKNKPLDPQAQQLAALVDAVSSMKDAVATQGKAIEALLAKQK